MAPAKCSLPQSSSPAQVRVKVSRLRGEVIGFQATVQLDLINRDLRYRRAAALDYRNTVGELDALHRLPLFKVRLGLPPPRRALPRSMSLFDRQRRHWVEREVLRVLQIVFV